MSSSRDSCLGLKTSLLFHNFKLFDEFTQFEDISMGYTKLYQIITKSLLPNNYRAFYCLILLSHCCCYDYMLPKRWFLQIIWKTYSDFIQKPWKHLICYAMFILMFNINCFHSSKLADITQNCSVVDIGYYECMSNAFIYSILITLRHEVWLGFVCTY